MKIKVFQNSQIENIVVSKLIKPGFRLEKSGKHKKGKKCCGLSLLLFIMLGLSLNVCSDTSAKKFTIDSIPLYKPSIYTSSPNFYSENETFSMIVSDDVDLSLLRSQYVVSLYSSNNNCSYRTYNQQPNTFTLSNGKRKIYYGFSGLDSSDSSYFSNFDPCLSVGSISNISSTSYPSVGYWSQDLKNMIPFRFKYDSFYRTSTGPVGGNGIDLTTKFDLLSLFGPGADNSSNEPSEIYELYIPFGTPNVSVLNSLSPDTPIQFDGEFVIDPDNPSTFGGFDSVDFTLISQYISISGGSSSSTVSCTSSFGRDNPDDSSSVWYLRYSCPTTIWSSYDSSYQRPWFQLRVTFNYSDSVNNKFRMLIFDDSFSITDNDTSPGGTWGYDPTGSDVNNAPGSIYQTDITHAEENFLSSLIGLFQGINLINPFAPIFGLFTAQNDCAQIPTLSSMLHSEETEVCPWFDSTTRSIVTPVLGLSSMMLLFGFVVRWLGARSGNFVEDSGGIDSGGFHFENKFRRKK